MSGNPVIPDNRAPYTDVTRHRAEGVVRCHTQMSRNFHTKMSRIDICAQLAMYHAQISCHDIFAQLSVYHTQMTRAAARKGLCTRRSVTLSLPSPVFICGIVYRRG